MAFCLWLSPSCVTAAEPVDLLLLRDTICDVETLGQKNREKAHRRADLGYCQTKLETAIRMGGLDPEHPEQIFHAPRAKEVAFNILAWCMGVKRRQTVLGLAACWKEPNSPVPKKGHPSSLRRYAEKVAELYRQGVKQGMAQR